MKLAGWLAGWAELGRATLLGSGLEHREPFGEIRYYRSRTSVSHAPDQTSSPGGSPVLKQRHNMTFAMACPGWHSTQHTYW